VIFNQKASDAKAEIAKVERVTAPSTRFLEAPRGTPPAVLYSI